MISSDTMVTALRDNYLLRITGQSTNQNSFQVVFQFRNYSQKLYSEIIYYYYLLLLLNYYYIRPLPRILLASLLFF